MAVNTRKAPRREVRYATFEEILADVDRIEDAVRAGTATTTGNWTIGQIAEHCAKFIRSACDGFETRAPWPLRVVARALLLNRALGQEPMPAGFRLPRQASALLPTPGIPDLDGLGELRKELKRVLAGKEMTAVSPLLGRLTHEQWVILQCKHCALHLGFIRIPDTTR